MIPTPAGVAENVAVPFTENVRHWSIPWNALDTGIGGFWRSSQQQFAEPAACLSLAEWVGDSWQTFVWSATGVGRAPGVAVGQCAEHLAGDSGELVQLCLAEVRAEGLLENAEVDDARVLDRVLPVRGEHGVDLTPVARRPVAFDPSALDESIDDPSQAPSRHAQQVRQFAHLQSPLRCGSQPGEQVVFEEGAAGLGREALVEDPPDRAVGEMKAPPGQDHVRRYRHVWSITFGCQANDYVYNDCKHNNHELGAGSGRTPKSRKGRHAP
jgi:hypothetical protein